MKNIEIDKRTIACLPKVYSIARAAMFDKDNQPAILAGSEADGPLLLLEPPDYDPQVIAESPGGYISVWSFVHNGEPYCVAAVDFKPGFNAAQGRIVIYPLAKDKRGLSIEVGSLPYTHRVAIVNIGREKYFLGSTLCSKKAFRDDWSHPGGISLARIPDDLTSGLDFKQIVPGLSKNHGMEYCILNNTTEGFLISCMEGLMFIPIPDEPRVNQQWPHETIAEGEHSDAFALGGDIFTITPFHGTNLIKYSKAGDRWAKTVIDDSLNMGHIVWAGDLFGSLALIAGDRRSEKGLWFYRKESSGRWLRSRTIDSGIGPAQLAIMDNHDSMLLIVSAHANNEVVIYQLHQ